MFLLLAALGLLLAACMRLAPTAPADLSPQTASHDLAVALHQVDPVPTGTPIVLMADLEALPPNGQTPVITGATATLYIGESLVEIAMSALDGVFDSPSETAVLELGSLPLGVHEVVVSGFDDIGTYNTDSIMIAVFDPAAGFVTGGGWFESPPGAYMPDSAIVGKATFGISAKYKIRYSRLGLQRIEWGAGRAHMEYRRLAYVR